MFKTAIERIDEAALMLINQIDEHGEALRAYLDAERVENMTHAREAAINLRRALLGAQMGPLYWDAPPEMIERAVDDKTHTVAESANAIEKTLHQHRKG
jgi:hypothetical protein